MNLVIDMSERSREESRKDFLLGELRIAQERLKNEKEVVVKTILYGSDIKNAKRWGFVPVSAKPMGHDSYLVTFVM